MPAACHAQTVYRWVDEAGQLQLADQPPGIAAERLELPAGAGAAEGLRTGERARLRAVERQLAGQRRAARARQQQARSLRRRGLDACRQWRKALPRERDAERRKALARDLRAHCW